LTSKYFSGFEVVQLLNALFGNGGMSQEKTFGFLKWQPRPSRISSAFVEGTLNKDSNEAGGTLL